tara:strand:- start:851 stop:1006 length:156 start_codon:yes stop_codon:yes gene_type:complete
MAINDLVNVDMELIIERFTEGEVVKAYDPTPDRETFIEAYEASTLEKQHYI